MIVRFTFKAQADIQSIHDYIAAENPSAANGVVSAIKFATQKTFHISIIGPRRCFGNNA